MEHRGRKNGTVVWVIWVCDAAEGMVFKQFSLG